MSDIKRQDTFCRTCSDLPLGMRPSRERLQRKVTDVNCILVCSSTDCCGGRTISTLALLASRLDISVIWSAWKMRFLDVPRPWHRDVRQALRSADDWVSFDSHNPRKKRPSSDAPQLIPLTSEAPKTSKSS